MGLSGRTLDQFVTCHVWGYDGPAPSFAWRLQTQCECALVSEGMACARVTLSSRSYSRAELPQSFSPNTLFLIVSLLCPLLVEDCGLCLE